jgi:hypothetical protein
LERSRIASTFEIHSETLEAMFVYRTFIVVLPWTGMVDSLEKGAMRVGGDGIKSDMITGGRRREEVGRKLEKKKNDIEEGQPTQIYSGSNNPGRTKLPKKEEITITESIMRQLYLSLPPACLKEIYSPREMMEILSIRRKKWAT